MTMERWQEIARELYGHVVLEEMLTSIEVAACKRIAELEALLAQETANSSILEAKLAYRDSTQVSHSEECWRVHQRCAVRKVEHLRELLRRVAASDVELERVQEEEAKRDPADHGEGG